MHCSHVHFRFWQSRTTKSTIIFYALPSYTATICYKYITSENVKKKNLLYLTCRKGKERQENRKNFNHVFIHLLYYDLIFIYFSFHINSLKNFVHLIVKSEFQIDKVVNLFQPAFLFNIFNLYNDATRDSDHTALHYKT